MNGAESLVRTLADAGVTTCFSNPGTSEMHFVAALDRVSGIRCVLALFEGVATGAADGYYRIAGTPAATLLHLGPGLANGLANLHNARKAHSGIVNLVGDHASFHLQLDAPLTSDLTGIARTMSHWVRVTGSSRAAAADGAEAVAVAASGAGRIATLILPADSMWGPANAPAAPVRPQPRARAAPDAVARAAAALRSPGSALLLGGAALHGAALEFAGRIAAGTGCALLAENLNARMARGAGRARVKRLPYAVDAAVKALAGFRTIVLAGARAPVGFFAYPDKPSVLTPPQCVIVPLATADEDLQTALADLAAALDALNARPDLAAGPSTDLPEGSMTPAGIGQTLGVLIPEQAIVVDESVTTGRLFGPGTDAAHPHDWLNSPGGSIGFGLPLAVGAALAAPDRRVIALEGDGSAMYTPQALWTMARENLKVTVLVFANRAYEILKNEYVALGGGAPGAAASDMLSLQRPSLSWTAMAAAHGVESGVATDLSQLANQLRRGLRCDGPYLIEVMM